MQIPPTPDNEASRLLALQRLAILDTPTERDFDDITQLAAHLCDAPIALISLVDADRQWFKSRVGLDDAQGDRGSSFCGHAILSDQIFEVQDALLDERFDDNPLVTGSPKIRFYAGAPLISDDGFRLGTLCVIDQAPRVLTQSQRRSLEALARQVVRQFCFRALSRDLAATSEQLAQISALQTAVLNSPEMAMVAVTPDGVIVSFSQAAAELLEVQSRDVIGVRALGDFYSHVAGAERHADMGISAEVPDFSGLVAAGPQGLAGSGEWWMKRGEGNDVLVRVALSAVKDENAACVGYLAILHDITAQKRVESLVKTSQAFLRKIAERVPGVICQLRRLPDGTSYFPYASSGLAALFGVQPEEVKHDASPFFSMIHPDDMATTIASVDMSATTLCPWQHEYRIRMRDGALRWVYADALPEAEADGAILWNGFITDITGRKQSELALQDSQKFLRTLVANLPVGIYTKRMCPEDLPMGGRYLIWNAAAERMSGIPESQVMGRMDREVFPPAIADRHAAHDRELMSSREPVLIPVYTATHPDQSKRLLRMTSIPLFDAKGDVEFTMGISEDLTDLLTQQKELVQRTAELEAMNDASPLGLFRTDAQGKIIYVNHTFELITGLPADACTGDGWRSAMHPDDVHRVVKDWASAVEQNAPYHGTHRYVHASGEVVLVRARCSIMKSGDTVVGYVGTVDDITARRAASTAVTASETRLRLITNNVPGTIGYINADERFEFCNVHYKALLGMDQETMIGKTVVEAFGETAYAVIATRVKDVLGGVNQSFERSIEVNGVLKHHQCEYIADVDDTGRVAGFYALVTDVTGRRIAEQNRALAERRLRAITDNIPVSISYIDAEKRFQFANATMYTWTGSTPEQVIGKPVDQVLGPDAYAERRGHFDAVLAGERVEFIQTSRLGDTARVLQSTYIPDFSDDGRVHGFYTLSSDISDLKKTENDLIRLARFDSLTGLKNRSSLLDAMHSALTRARREQTSLAVMYLDIDRFKSINDSLGHAKGDLVLQEFARRLARSVRATDTVARLGGDEFVIVLESARAKKDVSAIAQKILDQIRAPWLLNGEKLMISTSIGIYYDEDHLLSSEELLKNADESLYKAKKNGRNQFIFFENA